LLGYIPGFPLFFLPPQGRVFFLFFILSFYPSFRPICQTPRLFEVVAALAFVFFFSLCSLIFFFLVVGQVFWFGPMFFLFSGPA